MRTVARALFFVFIVSLYGCSSIFTVNIGDILRNPRKYVGKEVTVKGKVTNIFSLFIVKSFKIEDGTGEIMVVTQKPLPRVNDIIKVHGKVDDAFSFGDQQLIVIDER